MGDQPGNREESRMTCKPYDIPKTLIWEAWLHVKANQGAAGIDAETIERFEKKLGDNLYKLWNRMSSGSCGFGLPCHSPIQPTGTYQHGGIGGDEMVVPLWCRAAPHA